ncbi:MAG: TlpA family protein disulfide reductase [Bacteroidetes bacterium]|nr:TlpA family protein disulfide reductase [Bacteroidota bacterium]
MQKSIQYKSVLFFVCIATSLFSENVVVVGMARGFENKAVHACFYDDLITEKELVAASATVNDTGYFRLTIQSPTIQKIYLRIDNLKGHLFVEPEKNYSVVFQKPDTSVYVNPYMDKNIDLVLLGLDSTDLNYRIMEFNELTDAFWMRNYQYFVIGRAKNKLDSFSVAMQKRFAHVSNPFFKTHLKSNLKSLEYGITQTLKNPAVTYFGKPSEISETNFEYMFLFNSVFKQYVQKLLMRNDASKLLLELNDKANYEGTIQEIKKMSGLTNDTIVELVLLKGLYELYYVEQVDRGSITALLNHIQKNSSIDNHKKIAQNVFYKLGRLNKNAEAPNFSLPDKTGKMHQLSDFKGKYVYLDFWASWCIPCLEEMKMIPTLKKKYGDKIEFVSISTDNTKEAMERFLQKNSKYDWVFLFDELKYVKDLYEIKAIPTYYLINPEGKMVQSPAEKPTGDIERTFMEITKVKQKKTTVGGK